MKSALSRVNISSPAFFWLELAFTFSPNCWKDYYFTAYWPLHLSQKSIDHFWACVFLDRQLYFFDQCGYSFANTTLSWLWVQFWNQELWRMFQLCFSRFFWLCGMPCNLTWILESAFPIMFLKKGHWDFDKDCIEFFRSL